MAYIHQISFDITREQLAGLGIGSPLQRVLSYLRLQLPDHQGFITSRAKYSLNKGEQVRVEVESVWEHYCDLQDHATSSLDRIIEEFGPHVESLEQMEYAEMD